MTPPEVLVCRDCCCGSPRKHPRTDHDGQLEALRATGAQVRVVDCLDECDRSNVVVVRRKDLPRKERDAWFGGVVTDRATDALCDWLAAGTPDELPAPVRGLRFRKAAPRRGR